MAYCTQAQIESAIGSTTVLQLTDDAGSGSIDADKVTEAIRDAGQEIDGYVRAHYSVPLAAPTPAMVNTICIDLAIHRLFRRRRATFGMPEDVMEMYSKRIAQLERINKGTLDLGVEAVPTASARVTAQTAGTDQAFTGGSSGTLKDFG